MRISLAKTHWTDEDSVLLCPACRGNNTHHDCVDVFNRPDEDAQETLLRVEGHQITINPPENKEPSPSSRRDGLRIRFWCEHCGAITALLIAQHKGQTILSTEILVRGIKPIEEDQA